MTARPPSPDARKRRIGTLKSGCAAICLLVPAAALAQDADEAIALDPITVEQTEADNDANSVVATTVTSGSGMPTDILNTASSVSVITEKEILERNAQTVEQVLQYTPGISTDFYGRDDRYDYFKIRGFDAYLYRDGLLIGEAAGGVREEPYAFERVEVLKGANSTSFGISDPGGAVNFITKVPTGERLRNGYITYGSFNHKEIGFDMGDTLNDSGTLSWRLTGKIQDAEAETDYSNDDETFFMGGLAWRPDASTTLSIVADYLYRDGYPNSSGYPTDVDFDRDVFLGEPDFNYLDTDRKTVTVKFDHDFGGGLSLGSTARYSDTSSGFGYVFLGATTSVTDTTVSRYYFADDGHTEDLVGDAHLMYETTFGGFESRTLGGIELRSTTSDNTLWYTAADDINWTSPVYSGGLDLDNTDPYQSTHNETQNQAVYLQQELTYNRVIANVGLRHDWLQVEETDLLTSTESSADYSATTARVGLTYRITDGLSAYASYAESVVPASVGLDPERGKQYEIGIKYRPAGMRALFTAAVYDLTKFDMTVTNADTLLEETIGEANVKGIDLEAKAEVTDRLSVIAGYSYLKSEILESDAGVYNGNELGSTPSNSGSLWVNYLIPERGAFGDLNLGLGARYTGDYWRSDANTGKTDAALLFDAAVTYNIAPATQLALNVQNLFDEKHVAQGGFSTDYYNAGRYVSLSLRHAF
ncbi:Ferric hydroxamate uptake [Marinibacterium anthonyi]|nr:Ferric hydroxamate uptake [Marinibacterium anthonyi]